MGLLDFLANPISSVVSAIGGTISNSMQAKENQKNRDWNEMMWNKTNEYNDPSAQRSRLENAGYNANLAISNGLTGLAQYGGNLGTNNNYENPLRGFNIGVLEAKQLQNQTKVADSEVNKNNAETRNLNAEARGKEIENNVKGLNTTSLSDMLKSTAKKLSSDALISKYQAGLLENQMDFSDYWRETEFTYVDSEGKEQKVVGWQLDVLSMMEKLRNLEFSTNQIVSTIGKIGAETLKVNAERNQVEQNIENLKQQLKLMTSQEFLNYAQADYYKASAYLSSVQAMLAPHYFSLAYSKAENELTYKNYELWLKDKFTTAQIDKIEAEVRKMGYDSTKIFVDVVNAWKNGNLDRYMKEGPQRYGTGMIGSVMGFIYDVLHMKIDEPY